MASILKLRQYKFILTFFDCYDLHLPTSFVDLTDFINTVPIKKKSVIKIGQQNNIV